MEESWWFVRFEYPDGPVYLVWAECERSVLDKLSRQPMWRKYPDLMRYARVVRSLHMVSDIIALDLIEDAVE